jgi:hypothetical protein
MINKENFVKNCELQKYLIDNYYNRHYDFKRPSFEMKKSTCASRNCEDSKENFLVKFMQRGKNSKKPKIKKKAKKSNSRR